MYYTGPITLLKLAPLFLRWSLSLTHSLFLSLSVTLSLSLSLLTAQTTYSPERPKDTGGAEAVSTRSLHRLSLGQKAYRAFQPFL